MRSNRGPLAALVVLVALVVALSASVTQAAPRRAPAGPTVKATQAAQPILIDLLWWMRRG